MPMDSAGAGAHQQYAGKYHSCLRTLRTTLGSVLGKLTRKPAVQAVKRQWRSLAKQFHPDL